MDSHCLFISPDQITSPIVREFSAYWKAKSGGAVAPKRSAIDPLEIRHLLPYLVIVALEPAPLRVRYRLVGTQVVESHGADFTNRYLDECGFLIEKELLESYRRVATEGAPVYLYYEWMREDWPHERGRFGASESGFYPLSSDGVAIDMAINISDPNVAPRPWHAPA
jgi:hypothetical protein